MCRCISFFPRAHGRANGAPPAPQKGAASNAAVKAASEAAAGAASKVASEAAVGAAARGTRCSNERCIGCGAAFALQEWKGH